MLVQEPRPYQSPDIVRFLERLVHHIPGKLLVSGLVHQSRRSQPVEDFLAQGGIPRRRPPGAVPRLRPGTDPGQGHLGLPRTRRTPTSSAAKEASPTPTAPAPRHRRRSPRALASSARVLSMGSSFLQTPMRRPVGTRTRWVLDRRSGRVQAHPVLWPAATVRKRRATAYSMFATCGAIWAAW